jgi:hypothetical protein
MPLIYSLPTLSSLIAGSIIGAGIVYGSGGRKVGDFELILFWGTLIGGICFSVGFIGPLYIGSESPQGPLFGIFISGPAGALLGCAIGVKRSIRVIQGRGGRPKT